MRPPAADTEVNQPCLLLPRNHLDRRAQRSRGSGHEFLLIASIPHRSRRHGPYCGDIELTIGRGHPSQDGADRRNRFRAEAARLKDARAQPGHFAIGSQYSGRFAFGNLGGFHSYGVAADINGGIAWHLNAIVPQQVLRTG